MPTEASRRQALPEALAWPLVGRDDELGRIAQAREGGEARGVVLSAPAGIGKSRLARDAVAAAERGGAMVTWVHATRSAATVPLGAFAAIIPADVRSDQPLELLRRSAESLATRADGRRIVLGVDDAQLLDPTSAALVLHLTMTGAAFVVATVRTSDPCPDAVQSLWKDAGALRLDLRALTEAETGELVESLLGGPVGRRALSWIFGSSQGNPLYLRELLIGALEEGALQDVGGLWGLTREPPPSRTLAELVASRMTDLGKGERRVIELLALGEPLPLAEMTSLAGTDALVAVEDLGLITITAPAEGAIVRLAHPLYGEVVRASMPVIRGLEARRELARTVQARPKRSADDALRVARWLLDAGDTPPVELLVDAAAAANPAGDPELAARLARMALDAGAGPETAMLLARAHTARGQLEEAAEVLAAIEGTITSRAAALEYLQQSTVVLFYGLQRGEEALARVGHAQTWWSDAAWQRALYPARVRLTGLTSGFAAGAALGRELLADPELESGERRLLEIVMLPSLFYSGRAREAYEIVVRRRPEVPLRDESDFLACIMSCIVAVESGLDIAAFGTAMHEQFARGMRERDRVAAGIAAVTIAVHHMLAGRYDDAARWLAESAEQLGSHDPFQTRKSVHALQAQVACSVGDADGAADAMRRCWELVGDRKLVDTDRSYIVRGAASLALAEGDAPGAQAMLLEASELLGEAVPIYAAQLLHEAMRHGARAKPLVARITALRARSDAPFVELYADHVIGVASADGAALLEVAEGFVALEAIRYGSEAAAHAAEAFAADGRQDSARRAATRSRELHALGQGGSAPQIRGLDSSEINLTRREAQLVELAAKGLTNAEIADRLVLSVRTVESHVYRAMQKLGVSDRRDL